MARMGGERNAYRVFGWKLKGKDLLEETGVDGKLLKWNLKTDGSELEPFFSVLGKAVGPLAARYN